MAKKKKKNKLIDDNKDAGNMSKCNSALSSNKFSNEDEFFDSKNFDQIEMMPDYYANDLSTGVEPEDIWGKVIEPFDPSLVRVEAKSHNAIILINRMRQGVINLRPAFQRKAGIWKNDVQSRLIESILINIPLPAFYIDTRDEENWIVVDGVQRLTALDRFIVKQDLRLVGLEFLTELENLSFSELPEKFKRRILESTFTIYEIEKETPKELTFNIFKRINTGGLPLSSQEIRHALNQGPATELLKELSELDEFKKATANGLSDARMTDRECILRFIAFTLTSYQKYDGNDLDGFLNYTMEILNEMNKEELDIIKYQFKRSMRISLRVFGKDAFRKRYNVKADRHRISKTLFETWSVNINKFDQLDNEFFLKIFNCRNELKEKFIKLMNKDSSFVDAISQGTGESTKVKLRFRIIESIIKEVIYDNKFENKKF